MDNFEFIHNRFTGSFVLPEEGYKNLNVYIAKQSHLNIAVTVGDYDHHAMQDVRYTVSGERTVLHSMACRQRCINSI